jgi:hypothetical protein
VEEKKRLLAEIASLIQADKNSDIVELDAMEFMSEEELNAIKNSLLKRKENRRQEQEKWYDEWVQKCGK